MSGFLKKEFRSKTATTARMSTTSPSLLLVLKLSSTSDVYEKFSFVTNLCKVVDLMKDMTM